MADEMRLREVAGDAPEIGEVLRMADLMRDALVSAEIEWSPETMGAAMTAAAMFAGMLFGQMIAIGAARDGDRRRAGEGIVQNFRSGVDVGKRNALRTILEHGGQVLQ